MRILTNQKVRALFGQITLCLMVFIILSIILILSEPTGTVLRAEEITPGRWRTVMSITLCTVGIGIAVLAVCYRYFREQDRMMEEAVAQIREFIAGDRDARIECDEEGELYRLFHEINSLAAILNAKAESEEKSRNFLRNTISDISHQLL